MNFIGGMRLASGKKLADELCSAQGQAGASKAGESQRISERGHAEHKVDRGLGRSGQSAFRLD